MSTRDELIAELLILEGEIERLERERMAAEAYVEFGSSRPQRLFRRQMELQRERDTLMKAVEQAELADACDLAFLDGLK